MFRNYNNFVLSAQLQTGRLSANIPGEVFHSHLLMIGGNRPRLTATMRNMVDAELRGIS
jgi:hypothetical protein